METNIGPEPICHGHEIVNKGNQNRTDFPVTLTQWGGIPSCFLGQINIPMKGAVFLHYCLWTFYNPAHQLTCHNNDIVITTLLFHSQVYVCSWPRRFGCFFKIISCGCFGQAFRCPCDGCWLDLHDSRRGDHSREEPSCYPVQGTSVPLAVQRGFLLRTLISHCYRWLGVQLPYLEGEEVVFLVVRGNSAHCILEWYNSGCEYGII